MPPAKRAGLQCPGSEPLSSPLAGILLFQPPPVMMPGHKGYCNALYKPKRCLNKVGEAVVLTRCVQGKLPGVHILHLRVHLGSWGVGGGGPW